MLAEDFLRNPEFTLKTWQLALKCKGLAALLKNGVAVESTMTGLKSIKLQPTFLFNVSIHRFETGNIPIMSYLN